MARISAVVFFFPAYALAAEHVVSPADLHRRAVAAGEAKKRNVEKLEKLFSAEPVGKVLRKAGIEAGELRKAAELLSEEELARLAARADRLHRDFAAGALTNEQLTYIVIALATAVIVLIAVS